MDVSAHLSTWIFSSRLIRLALEETDLPQSTQFRFLGMSAGSVLGQMEPAIMVCFSERQLFEF